MKIIKLIDYNFQHDYQLTGAYDDSNSMRYLDPNFEIILIGRFDVDQPEHHVVENYVVTFLPFRWGINHVAQYIEDLHPNIIHMHGNHVWTSYPRYAQKFKYYMPRVKLIFSPAGGSKGNLEFLKYFDVVIVNHEKQVERMRCEPEKVIVRKRCADPNCFFKEESDIKNYDFVYVAGFVPSKRLDVMIDTIAATKYSLVILGDSTRTREHWRYIFKYIVDNHLSDKIILHDFIPQTRISDFLSKCKAWVWPNIRPENPHTTTNRASIEALACGLPMLVGATAFQDSYIVKHGYNGYLYNSQSEFNEYADRIISNYSPMGYKSFRIAIDELSFKENFIDFYTNLYRSLCQDQTQ